MRIRVIDLLLAMFSIPAALSLVALAARWWWPLEQCSHFRAHYFLALAVGAMACALLRRRKMAFAFGAFALFNLAFIAPLYLSASHGRDDGTTIRLMSANVFASNRDRRLLQVVREMRPDVLLVIEATDAWLSALDTLVEAYPHRLASARRDAFGIALFSRLKVAQLEVREIGPAGVPSVFARLGGADGRLFYLIGSHPLSPVRPANIESRNVQLAALGELAATLDGPVVLIGDLNTTSWSPYFCDLLQASGLRDSRRGFGIQPTWPCALGALGIAIDHALVSPEIAVLGRTVGPDIGSDHRPIIVDLAIPERQDRAEKAMD